MNGTLSPQKDKSKSKSTERVNVTLFGKKRVFEDVIKDLEMISSWISWWALNPKTNVLKRDRRGKYTAKKRR